MTVDTKRLIELADALDKVRIYLLDIAAGDRGIHAEDTIINSSHALRETADAITDLKRKMRAMYEDQNDIAAGGGPL